MANLSNQPPKGTSDWPPEEFRIRSYIFDTWREVCTRFGYEEYLTPIVESAEIYRAKSGEDVGGKELMFFQDKAGRELAIRPEMTPSVTRLVSQSYESLPKPIRYFSIANFFRNEKPQRGRNREFWQLNFDIFGSDSLAADVEIIQMGIEIMLKLGANKDQFVVKINDRNLIEAMVTDLLKIEMEKVSEATRVLDKFGKLSNEELTQKLQELGASPESWDKFFAFLGKDEQVMQEYYAGVFAQNAGIQRMQQVWKTLSELGYSDYFTFAPDMVRGFDYYDGIVFEVFDKNPENTRSLFGGGRYNGLAGLFGGQSFPAVGCAPGDETTRLFLESWGLLDRIPGVDQLERTYIPILSAGLADLVFKLAQKLRGEGRIVEVGLEEQKLGKALEYADKKRFSSMIILGENEAAAGKYTKKNMQTGTQVEEML
ncbi:histidine--tRNA ligase [Candidatus Dojkabacteria bacterium]|uniref:Histidine--tRNA ligase n=1 Tax=Candidatus Dojkabacteria bacterium TaxID=2099670 RepID=A0A955L094_9BACT|nr:histidine--tRNA ligase [Candidatus Dojkabacteria bacterium]